AVYHQSTRISERADGGSRLRHLAAADQPLGRARRQGDRLGPCPLLAQSRHPDTHNRCPLLGVKQASGGGASMSANDPKRTLTGRLIVTPPRSNYFSGNRNVSSARNCQFAAPTRTNYRLMTNSPSAKPALVTVECPITAVPLTRTSTSRSYR